MKTDHYIVVEKPQMFCVDEAQPVSVYTGSGAHFYTSPKNFKGYFSLPVGRYYTTVQIKPTNKTRKLPYLPKKERNIKRPKKWVIYFDENPAKCSIKLETGEILFDKNLWERLERLERLFVLLHEFGHYYYKTERFCDLFAKRELLRMGYNKSQVATIDFGILGNGTSSFARKHWTFHKIKHT